MSRLLGAAILARQVLAIAVAICAFANAPAWAQAARTVVPLDAAWLFRKGETGPHPGAVAGRDGWSYVRLPHTWNGADGEDGGGYYRGPGWYVTTLQLSPRPGRRFWLEFDGAALTAEVWINGQRAGRHDGGYARFRFDVTDALRAGDNRLAVKVDNSPSDDVAPLGGDFTVFGGLYRPVRLIETNDAHIDLSDHGGPGIAISSSNVNEDAAIMTFGARVANDGARRLRARLRTRVADADGRVALELTTPVTANAGAIVTVDQSARLERPRLWRGRRDPHLYTVTSELLARDGSVLDRVTLQTGVRSVAVDPQRGFLLNGEPYPLYGVNYFHAGRPGRGLAVQDAEIDADLEIIEAQGATAVRFVHFQHPQRAYDLADRLGLAVWTEAPLNAKVAPSSRFAENLAHQMRELIRQNRHHPSVVVWGLGNEVYATDDAADASIALMQRVAKAEDAGRPTAYAHCCQDDLDRKALHADLTAYNRYFGWYDGEFGRIGAWADERRARDPARPVAVSEYGAGASVLHQQDPPERPRPDGPWHPEQYQAALHEAYWPALKARPWLWGAFVWVAFDLASDGRNEGDRPGINDKGLVTYDRAVRKDAWYWYQAHWSEPPMVHLTNRRLTARSAGPASVRAYSNLDALELFVNGVSAGSAPVRGHVASWSNIVLSPGVNVIEARGPRDVSDRMIVEGIAAPGHRP